MLRFLQVVGLALVLCVFIAVVTLATPRVVEVPRSDYFPPNRLKADPMADRSADLWYSTTLRNMDFPAGSLPKAGPLAQPPLYKLPETMPAQSETYRALISYGREYLMAVRVYRVPEGAYVVANEIDFRGQGGQRKAARQLTGDEWSELNRVLEGAKFFNQKNVRSGFSGDCVDWVIEGRQGDRYNLVSLSCPTQPELKQLADYFTKTAGWYPY